MAKKVKKYSKKWFIFTFCLLFISITVGIMFEPAITLAAPSKTIPQLSSSELSRLAGKTQPTNNYYDFTLQAGKLVICNYQYSVPISTSQCLSGNTQYQAITLDQQSNNPNVFLSPIGNPKDSAFPGLTYLQLMITVSGNCGNGTAGAAYNGNILPSSEVKPSQILIYNLNILKTNQYGMKCNPNADPGQNQPTDVALAKSASQCQPNSSNSNCTCQSSGGALSWLICAGIDIVTKAENYVINVVQDLLKTNPINFSSVSSKNCIGVNSNCNTTNSVSATTYSVWSNFRILGDVVLVIALLVAIIIEAAGGGSIAEAYTVKRMLPRILAAAILINLSIYLVAGLEDIFNILGQGLLSLIQAPFSQLYTGIKISGGTSTLASLSLVGIAVGVGFTEGIAGLALLIFGGFLLAAIGVLVTLMIRQGLIYFLVIISPVAFALYALPNTEQYFKKWWDLLLKTLMVYPIVTGILAVSTIAKIVITNFPFPGVPNLIIQLMGILAAIAPLFLIPFAFKMSGGVIGSMANTLEGIKGKIRQPISSLRSRNRKERIERASRGKLFRGGETGFGARANRIAQNMALANKAGLRPNRMRANLASARATMDHSEIERNLKENADYATWANDDELNRAATESNNEASLRASLRAIDARRVANGQSTRFSNPDMMDQAVARIQRVRRSMSQEAFRQMTAVGSLRGGTAYADADEAWEAVVRAAGNDDSALQNMVGQGRSALMQAGRVDQGGASFGTTLTQSLAMRDELRRTGTISQATRDRVNKEIYESAADSSSPAQAIYGKPSSAKHLAEAHALKIRDMMTSLNTGQSININGVSRIATEADIKQELASTAGLYDAMAQSSPQNAREYADGLTSIELPTTNMTGNLRASMTLHPDRLSSSAGNISVREAMENLRVNDVDFQNMRRDYGTNMAAEAQRAMSNGLISPGPTPPPTGGMPGGPPNIP